MRVWGSQGFKCQPWRVGRSGVTLIELMVVMAVVIIMTATGVMALGKTDVNTLRASALQVQALFDRARQTALAQRTWTCVAVSSSASTFTLYLRPTLPTTSGVAPTSSQLGTSSQVLTLPSVVCSPSQFVNLSISGELLYAYFNHSITQTATPAPPYVRNNDYINATNMRTIYLWFDGFGQPNIDSLSSTTWPGVPGNPSDRNYGFVNLATRNGSAVVEVMVYAYTGITGLRWIKR